MQLEEIIKENFMIKPNNNTDFKFIACFSDNELY